MTGGARGARGGRLKRATSCAGRRASGPFLTAGNRPTSLTQRLKGINLDGAKRKRRTIVEASGPLPLKIGDKLQGSDRLVLLREVAPVKLLYRLIAEVVLLLSAVTFVVGQEPAVGSGPTRKVQVVSGEPSSGIVQSGARSSPCLRWVDIYKTTQFLG